MPKLPRDLSGRAIARALERAGFALTRQVGSHATFRKGLLVTTVPMHHAVRTGTLRSILRDAGLSVQEFIEFL